MFRMEHFFELRGKSDTRGNIFHLLKNRFKSDLEKYAFGNDEWLTSIQHPPGGHCEMSEYKFIEGINQNSFN